MEACGNYVGLGSWNALSVLKTVCQRTPSQIMAGDYEIVCGWIQQNQNIATETKSMCSVGPLRV